MATDINPVYETYANRTIKTVTEAVKSYANDVRQVFPVVKAFFFGSWVKGTATIHSDVDVCFFLENCGDRSERNVILDIDLMTLKYAGMIIEPHIFKAKTLNSQHPFIREILETGIEI